MAQHACSEQVAAESVRVQHALQASNDPCAVYWRSFEVRQHPERAFYLECNGLKAYPTRSQQSPVSLAECDRKLRQRQVQMGGPVSGMTDEQKAAYRATWGRRLIDRLTDRALRSLPHSLRPCWLNVSHEIVQRGRAASR